MPECKICYRQSSDGDICDIWVQEHLATLVIELGYFCLECGKQVPYSNSASIWHHICKDGFWERNILVEG